MPGALDGLQPSLSSSDLAWLAIQDDVESRLVITHGAGDETRYEVRHGPFGEEDLSALPEQNWTLLVQDVEKHLPPTEFELFKGRRPFRAAPTGSW